MAESFPNVQKILWEKQKLLVTMQTHKNQGLFGKGLKKRNKYFVFHILWN